ncbi:2OG-Fe(II) oxygenase family protein [Streptomyces tsukubensis]|uniref:Fe2OG dioxygenase domain-containing protein n=1 Tax=Streptomyces tsukubensis TaxID=83656 RepID=A0A1V4A0L2_9ACTN|nr:2OG-Fe(II) oxygenase family protein [Streptomyces tsukubensis]OON72075.1 hypothetical protein B1H18_31365 [Streptomyces tsukubensis]QFR93297.1 isopenicillin N synthase family oxygenase [Streptomyces tsukubensis]
MSPTSADPPAAATVTPSDSTGLCEAALEHGRIDGGYLVFDDGPPALGRALQDGMFLVDIPADVAVATGDAFAEHFFRGPTSPPYGEFRDITSDSFGDPLLGFHQRANKSEQFLLERRFWDTRFPDEMTALGEAMTRLSSHIMAGVLAYSGIPYDRWGRATGDCVLLGGTYHLTFNHYLPTHLDLGLNPHQDDGFLTILRATTPGLEIDRGEGTWQTVTPPPGCFVVNFGLAMEILTSATRTPATAVLHRVSGQRGDRFSFAHFASVTQTPGADSGVHRYLPATGALERVCTAQDLLHSDYAASDVATGT